MRSTERWHKFVRSCLLLVSTKERVPNGNRREQRAPIVWRESKGTSEGSLLVERSQAIGRAIGERC